MYTFSTFVAFGHRMTIDIVVYRYGYRVEQLRVDVPFEELSNGWFARDCLEVIERMLSTLSVLIKRESVAIPAREQHLRMLNRVKEVMSQNIDDEYVETTVMSYLNNIQGLGRLTLVFNSEVE